jgi:hypothetical protein
VAGKLHGKDFAEGCTGDIERGIGHVVVGLPEKVGPDEEAGIDDGHILEAGILEDEWADDGEVDIGGGQLAGRRWADRWNQNQEFDAEEGTQTNSQARGESGNKVF